MLFTPQPPQLEPDAPTYRVTRQPTPTECGSHSFARDIAGHLEALLGGQVSDLLVRENPFDRRDCPRAWAYQLTFTDAHALTHQASITVFEARYPLTRGPVTAYAIVLDDQPIEFTVHRYDQMAWQLARTLWIAVTDGHIAAQRAAQRAAERARTSPPANPGSDQETPR